MVPVCYNKGGGVMSVDADIVNSFPDSFDHNILNNSFMYEDKADASEILNNLRKSNLNNVILGHLNINSIANKVDSLSFIVQETIDILVIGESKLNKSHTTAQLQLPGFNEPFRLDRVNENGGGGVLIYIRSDIPSRKLSKHNFTNDIEGLFIEFNFRKSKWLLFGAYRPPKQNKLHFTEHVSKALDIYIQSFDRIILIGDFNLDINDVTLSSLMSAFNLKSLIKEPTCFKSIESILH